MVQEKRCRGCQRTLPIRKFWKAGTKDGRQQYVARCIECERKRRGQTELPKNWNERGQKQCAKCKRYLDVSWYHKAGAGRRGKYHSYCKVCFAKYSADRYYARREVEMRALLRGMTGV